MKRSTLLASTAALLLSAGVAVAAGEAVKQQAANDMPPPPHGDHSKNHRHPNQMGNKFQRDGLPRGFDELDLSDVGAVVSSIDGGTPLREDVSVSSDVIEMILKNAPMSSEHFFVVPKIIE